jgi:hypothetical protein
VAAADIAVQAFVGVASAGATIYVARGALKSVVEANRVDRREERTEDRRAEVRAAVAEIRTCVALLRDEPITLYAVVPLQRGALAALLPHMTDLSEEALTAVMQADVLIQQWNSAAEMNNGGNAGGLGAHNDWFRSRAGELATSLEQAADQLEADPEAR